MRPRLVDWTLFALATFAAGSGFGAWVLLDAQAAPVIAVHAAVGLVILVPLAWKFRRVRPRVTHAGAWDWKTPLSILTAMAAVGSAVTGILWTHAQAPVGYPNGMHLHIVLGIALMVLLGGHVVLRFRRPTQRDLPNRRDALRWLGMLGLGALALPVQRVINDALELPGAQRRFSGSRSAGDDTGPAMPVTNWMFDRPTPVDTAMWRLMVHGAVEHPLALRLSDLRQDYPVATLRATLDCTGGWHSTQDWRGVRVGDLLDRAGARAEARFVSFVSVTGYRWSLPLAEAREALLATHYEDAPLDHWHGAPLRLVAPGRRGFMWVKWVREVVALTEPDLGRWIAIFTSGFSDG
ncbi:MAG: sulfite oxidase [Chloroflexi bacterium]|uniref:Sulfite oxidase n=1 Tax=Candidatus Thermofonsia Clade 3 bacterium TaxID=2364212 RepID=A0A2M8QCQ6_9CHLR|nr:molybdopterin-dependent oxidoreductase [Candidatus Roseilinea sp. NK_OTU-006]PJF47589.1 MAG: sulfite oxidase [Candidatus Thermofonsia Clade 3 bacterium]RMG65849.1 MAG: sulfite oxidase [Chloroflexota bacterium]